MQFEKMIADIEREAVALNSSGLTGQIRLSFHDALIMKTLLFQREAIKEIQRLTAQVEQLRKQR